MGIILLCVFFVTWVAINTSAVAIIVVTKAISTHNIDDECHT